VAKQRQLWPERKRIAMNSLKRKKSASSGKSAQKGKGTQSVSSSPRKAAVASSGTLANATNAIDGLQHLIDRPYYDYDNKMDDIGLTHSISACFRFLIR